MSRCARSAPRRRVPRAAAIPLLLTLAWPAHADLVQTRDGRSLEGHVRSIDERTVVLATPKGDVRIPRVDVEVIRLEQGPEVAPPLKVEIRNVHSDDAVDVMLDQRVVIRDARHGGEWTDVTPWLKDGNNPIRLRIHNARGTWAYHVVVRINGEVVPLACGTALRTDDPCTCCGKTGREHGTIDDLPTVWLHVDRALGRAELQP